MFQHNDLHRNYPSSECQLNDEQKQEIILKADLHLAERGYTGIALIPLLFFIAAYATDFYIDYPPLFYGLTVMMVVSCLARVQSVLKLRSSATSGRVFWQRYYFFSSLASGLCWGVMAAAFLYFYGASWKNVMVLFIVAGIGGGAITSYSNWLHLNQYYLLVLFGPIAIVSFFFCEKSVMLIGTLSILSYLYNLAQAKLWNGIYWRSLVNVSLLDSEVRAHQKAQILLREEIAERRQVEEDLLVAKEEAEAANNAKSEFLANMSHEMRTPLHAMLGFANVGRKHFTKAPRERLGEYFSLIYESGERLLSFLTDLLDLATLDVEQARYDFQQYDLNLSITGIIDEVQLKLHENNIGVSFQGDQPHMAQFDRRKIIQVLHNLLDNALKFSQPETTIAITVEEVDIAEETFQRIRVKDQGIGLPEAELETVFDKFKQSSKTKTGAGGTGLGLAICKGILEAHSGKIWAENNPEGGSSFYFVLPVAPAK